MAGSRQVTTGPAPSGTMVDLRLQSHEDVLDRVERALDVRLDRVAAVVRKRRSIGLRTMRGTWVRIEARPADRITGQGWNGVECASVLRGVAKPAWLQAVSWSDAAQGLMWRADEIELITSPPIKPGGTLKVDPNLSGQWWATLTSSLSALAGHMTTRVATPTMQPIGQDRVSSTIHEVFPDVDTTVDEWRVAHGDLFWTNVTAPECVLLDWKDWGMAPRGYDAASLWYSSLAVPTLAERVYRELRSELDTRSGLLSQLMYCAGSITAPPGYADEILTPAKMHALRIFDQLIKPQ